MSQERLSILVVGAGIAGLSTGLALRAFADVTILDSVRELKEVGAAVTLGSGAVNILRGLGVHLEREGGVLPESFQIWSSDGQMLASTPFGRDGQPNKDIISVHRSDLQRALLSAVTDEAGQGKPCKILLGQKVLHVDVENGKVVTADGMELCADVLVGADGIRSKVRPFVTGGEQTPQPAGEMAYRLLVPVEDLVARQHPLVKNGVLDSSILGIMGSDTKIIAYPVRGGTLMNLVVFVPDTLFQEETSDSWTATGSASSLQQSTDSYAPLWKSMLACAKGDVGIWQMRDMDPLPHWVKGRTIIIGDAAHPVLPHQAAGALSALEDAEALGTFLRGTTRAMVPMALRRVFRTRLRRVSGLQAQSRAQSTRNMKIGDANGAATIRERWEYPGAEAWERERPDMVLAEAEE